jgi:hypothetical protein
MKEYKSIEGLDSSQTQIPQESQSGSRIRTSNPKALRTPRSSGMKWFALTKECKPIEAIHKMKRQIRQESQVCAPIQT